MFLLLDAAHSNCFTWIIEKCTKILKTRNLCISNFKFHIFIQKNLVEMVSSFWSISMSEGYPELYQSSKMECFAKTQKRKPYISIYSFRNSLLKKYSITAFFTKLSCELIKDFLRNKVGVIATSSHRRWCSIKRCSWKLFKIHKKTPVPGSLF